MLIKRFSIDRKIDQFNKFNLHNSPPPPNASLFPIILSLVTFELHFYRIIFE